MVSFPTDGRERYQIEVNNSGRQRSIIKEMGFYPSLVYFSFKEEGDELSTPVCTGKYHSKITGD